MTNQTAHLNTRSKSMPILARHAVSLSIAFALGLVFSYFAGQFIYQEIQHGKLTSADETSFQSGLAFVLKHAGTNQSTTEIALDAIQTIPPERAADLLLAVAQSHANQAESDATTLPKTVTDLIAPLMKRMSASQSIGLYDGLIQIKGINPMQAANDLLAALNPVDDAELLRVVDLLDTRLLWSRRWAPLDLWVRWLGVLAISDSKLTQFQTVKWLGELPEAADDPRIAAGLALLAASAHEEVRNAVLPAVAGYAMIAKDPTDYEQIIFQLGQDANTTIARRAWMVVGHLNPSSGYAVDWMDADPSVAEAMLWASAKTNPDNPDPIWLAYDNKTTRVLSLQALGLLRDTASIERFHTALTPVPSEQIDIDADRLIDALTSNQVTEAYEMDLACVSLAQLRESASEIVDRLLRTNQSAAQVTGAFTATLIGARPTLIGGITADFLRQHPDLDTVTLRSMSDQKLGKLGLQRIDALTALLDAAEAAPPSANRAGEAKLLKLALWMRGDLDEDFTPTAEDMLVDEDVPTSTVLLALLYKQRPVALHYLFGDRVTPRPDLHDLFIQKRYWYVFQRFVDTSDLTLWLWGDSDAQAFQLESMRQWHAVNRWRIGKGWWPSPNVDD